MDIAVRVKMDLKILIGLWFLTATVTSFILPDSSSPPADHRRCSNATRETTEGFDYLPDAPVKNFSLCTPSSFPNGTRLAISGRVIDDDCRTALPSILDVWSTNPDGEYSDEARSMECRARIYTDQDGYFDFATVMPGWSRRGCGNYRPAHIYWKVTPIKNEAYRTLITQMYIKHDPYLGDKDPCPIDDCHSDDPTLVVPLEKQNGDNYWARFDIVMQKSCLG